MSRPDAARSLRDLAAQGAGQAQEPVLGLGRPNGIALGARSAAERFVWPRVATLGEKPWAQEEFGFGISRQVDCGCAASTAGDCCGPPPQTAPSRRCNDVQGQPVAPEDESLFGLGETPVWMSARSSFMPKTIRAMVGTTALGLGRTMPAGLGGLSFATGLGSVRAAGLGAGAGSLGRTVSSSSVGGSGVSKKIGGSGSKARIELPDFTDTAIQTQLCFAYQFQETGWPSTDVEAPLLNQRQDCDLPSGSVVLETLIAVGGDGYDWDQAREAPGTDPNKTSSSTQGANVKPTLEDVQLFGTSVALLLENLDIVCWAVGLVDCWSPEVAGLGMEALVRDLLTPDAYGRLGFGVTYVESAYRLNPNTDLLEEAPATAWAFTIARPAQHGGVGVILPVRREYHPWTHTWLPAMEKGGVSALCAATTVAGIVLHELIHVVADHWDADVRDYVNRIAPYTGGPNGETAESERIGSIHENDDDDDEFLFGAKGGIKYDIDGVRVKNPSFVRYPCWDECRMVASLFTWGMSQRRPCLLDVVPRPDGPRPTEPLGENRPCEQLGDPRLVALSFDP